MKKSSQIIITAIIIFIINFNIFNCFEILTSSIAYADPYAINVIDYYNPNSGTHTDPNDALGAPDSVSSDIGIYSMGVYGWIELELGQPVYDIDGFDLGVWEESNYSSNPDDWLFAAPDESADIYLSFDSTNWVLVGQARRSIPGSMVYDINGLGVSGATYIRIEDISGNDYPNFEGFDLDAVTVFESPPVVPEPISSILFLAGGTLLVGRRYMKKNKKT